MLPWLCNLWFQVTKPQITLSHIKVGGWHVWHAEPVFKCLNKSFVALITGETMLNLTPTDVLYENVTPDHFNGDVEMQTVPW